MKRKLLILNSAVTITAATVFIIFTLSKAKPTENQFAPGERAASNEIGSSVAVYGANEKEPSSIYADVSVSDSNGDSTHDASDPRGDDTVESDTDSIPNASHPEAGGVDEVCCGLVDPADGVAGLIAAVEEQGLSSQGGDILRLLRSSLRVLSNERPQDDRGAVLLLQTFINRVGRRVERMGSIQPQDAEVLIAQAQAVIELIP